MIKLPTLLLCPLALICALEMAYAQSFLPQSSTQSPDATQALIPEAERAVQNLNIDVNNGQLTLSWTADPAAFSYRLYSSATPEGNSSPDFTGSYSGVSWTAEATENKRFYRVVAVSPGVPGEMVIVQGGTFNLEYDAAIITLSSFRLGQYEVTQ